MSLLKLKEKKPKLKKKKKKKLTKKEKNLFSVYSVVCRDNFFINALVLSPLAVFHIKMAASEEQ